MRRRKSAIGGPVELLNEVEGTMSPRGQARDRHAERCGRPERLTTLVTTTTTTTTPWRRALAGGNHDLGNWLLAGDCRLGRRLGCRAPWGGHERRAGDDEAEREHSGTDAERA